MINRQPIDAGRVRRITGSFAFIEHRFLRQGFWTGLSHHALLLYVFLVLAADQQGLSFYGYDRICSLLGMVLDEYLQARDELIKEDLIAFDGTLWNAFLFFGDVPRELVHDNMLTAVIERDGTVVRYNIRFLYFLRRLKVTPRACNPASPQEKGKVEKGVIHYIRHNFWPLRSFETLTDLQQQADQWRDGVANVRIHATTGEKPLSRYRHDAMAPLPKDLDPDLRDLAIAKVHTDFSVCFDGNTYSVTPWLVGKQVNIAPDHLRIFVSYKDRTIADHPRSWHRKQRIESPHHRQEALKGLRKQWATAEVAAFAGLGEDARTYLEATAKANIPLLKDVRKILELKDPYGADPVLDAVRRALLHNAIGSAYIENILRQNAHPTTTHPPLRLDNERLNRIRLEEPLLAPILPSIKKLGSTKTRNSWFVTNSAICRLGRLDQTSFSKSSAKDTSRGQLS